MMDPDDKRDVIDSLQIACRKLDEAYRMLITAKYIVSSSKAKIEIIESMKQLNNAEEQLLYALEEVLSNEI